MKLLFRCKEFFIIRVRVVKIMRMISEREGFINTLKKTVSELNENDEKELEMLYSKKSKSL